MNLQSTIELYAEKQKVWIGFDLDGTLAEWKSDQDTEIIGKLIEGKPASEFRQAIKAKKEVKIVTARVSSQSPDKEKQRKLVQDWIKEHFGISNIEVTSEKDSMMLKLYDDKAIQVKRNKGTIVK